MLFDLSCPTVVNEVNKNLQKKMTCALMPIKLVKGLINYMENIGNLHLQVLLLVLKKLWMKWRLNMCLLKYIKFIKK